MGRSKGLLLLAGRPLLAWHLERLAPFVSRAVVVIGHDAEAHRAALPEGVEVVENPAWAVTEPADSLRLALVRVAGPCLVMPVDVAPPAPETLRALLAAEAPVVPVDPRGRPGHPVLLDPETVARVRERAPPGGLRTLLGDAREVEVADPWVARDFDDTEAWARFVGAWRG